MTWAKFRRPLNRHVLEDLRHVVAGKKHLLVYTVLMGCTSLLSFLVTPLFAKLLSPEALGHFSLVTTIASYGILIHLGLLSGLTRELPVTLGQGDTAYAARLVGECTLIVGGMAVAGLLLYSIAVNAVFSDQILKTVFLLAGILAISNIFLQIVIVRLRSERRLFAFPVVLLVQRLAILVAGGVAIYLVGFAGAIYVWIAINVVLFWYATKRLLPAANYRVIRVRDLAHLSAIGLPLTMAGLVDNFRLTMDRLFVFGAFGPHELGLYQVGLIPLTASLILGGIVNQYLSPKLLSEYGMNQSLMSVFQKSLLVSLMLGLPLLALWPVVSTVTPFVVRQLLPEYVGSETIISIFYLGGAIATATAFVSVTLNAANKQFFHLMSSVIVAPFCLISYFVLMKFNRDIQWFAYVNVAGIAVNSLLLLAFSYYFVRSSAHRSVT